MDRSAGRFVNRGYAHDVVQVGVVSQIAFSVQARVFPARKSPALPGSR
jgi:hypothetical protein